MVRGGSRSRDLEDGCDSDLLELDALSPTIARHRFHNPVHVVPIRDEVAPQLRRVIVENLFDGREAVRRLAWSAYCNMAANSN